MSEREENAPETMSDIETGDVSRAVDRMTEIDRHRRRTLRGVPARLVDSERHVARQARTERAISTLRSWWSFLGFLAFVMEVWRIAVHGWP